MPRLHECIPIYVLKALSFIDSTAQVPVIRAGSQTIYQRAIVFLYNGAVSQSRLQLSPSNPAQLLNYILEAPDLIAAVEELAPATLAKLIDTIGVEECGDILSMATSEQLTQIFDGELWRSNRPGLEDQFDAQRFVLWLEVLAEGGEELIADRLDELPFELVLLGFYRHILVINIDRLAVELAGQDTEIDLTDKALQSCLYHEFGEYQVISKQHDGWDTILAALVTLDEHNGVLFHRILERCFIASSEFIEENGGLYQVLTSEEMIESDAAADREDRRARQGYISPSSASSFLRLARQTPLSEIVQAQRSDPITRAYFRELEVTPRRVWSTRAPAHEPDAPTGPISSVEKLVTVLQDAGIAAPEQPHYFLGSDRSSTDYERQTLFERAVVDLRELAPLRHGRIVAELAYLANVLIAGCRYGDAGFRPIEALRAAIATGNLGLEHLIEAAPRHAPDETRRALDLLIEESPVKLFRIGWQLLYSEVALDTSLNLEQVLVQSVTALADTGTQAQLADMMPEARAAMEEGAPWRMGDALDAFDVVFDESTLTALKALLAEYPVLRLDEDDSADLRRQREPHKATFFATRHQIRRARNFVRRLAGAASR